MKKATSKFFLFCIVLCNLLICCTNNKSPTTSTNVTDNAEKLSIAEKLKENSQLSVKEQVTLFYKLKKESPDKYNFRNEDELTMYGYSFLWNGEIKNALEIFKLIVAEFPDSSNPYDSLGEAYLANGDEELSLINYEKSLALNPDNFNAEDQIERIKHPEIKQPTPAERFAQIYSVEAYQKDLDQLGETLLSVNPNALKFISKKDFLKTIEEKKALINEQTTYAEFTWHCREIIANVGCSHTSLGGFYTDSEMLPIALGFPVQTNWVEGKLFVTNTLNNSKKVALQDEIMSINGVAIDKIMRDVYKRIPSQGHIETSKRHFFNSWSTDIIPYALNFPKTYEVQIAGKKGPILLNPATTSGVPFSDKSVKYCEDDLCLDFPNEGKSALMTINSFNYYNWNNFDVFQKFIDNSFKEIKKRGVEKLIIDLRLNGGGSPESSIYLLKHLINKPFTYFENTEYLAGKGIQQPFEHPFKGNVYFLIDGNGKSTTGHFMAIVKDLKLGTIIGEELGSNQFCTGGQTICRLTNSKVLYYVANSTSKLTVKSLPDERGILPDHYVSQSIADYLNNTDTVKEYAFKLAKNAK